jgi:asparagine synthase (glutamine-hydrolysing)
MCGIFGCFGPNCDRMACIEAAHKQIHRGPDDFYCQEVTGGYMCFTRLNIMDRTVQGRQPFVYNEFVGMTNGEIYNHKELEKEYGIERKGNSDCELIPELFSKIGEDLPRKLDGMFGTIVANNKTGDIFITRDHMGIIPLYWGEDEEGRLYVASEQKCLVDVCVRIEIFPPRMYYYGQPKMGHLKQWYHMDWVPETYAPGIEDMVLERVYKGLYRAVEKMLPCDSPNGFLLSGGLDSSLVAAFARRILGPEHILHTFTIGLEGAPDFAFAREVAEHIGSVHHEFKYTLQEGLDVIPQVIQKIETWDDTTIRSSTPQYLLAKRVQSWGFKSVMSGEGADEAWGGYLYFHYAPNDEEFHEEMKDKLADLHFYDCLRTNKSMLASGVETRVPFLDPDFLEIAMTIPVQMKHPKYYEYNGRPIEKGILRKACDRGDLLPKSVLWRQKEQFSDSVGYGWIDGIKAHYKSMGTTETQFNQAMYKKYNFSTATVKSGKTVACSTPRGATWVPEGTANDASGRSVLGVHQSTAKESLLAETDA